MEDELVQFLEENSLQILGTVFEKHQVYSLHALKNITDTQYAIMGLAIGQVAWLKSSLEKISKGNEESREQRIQSLVEKIRHGNRNATASKTKTSTSVQPKKQKSLKMKKMYVGWLHRSSVNDKYRQVKQLKDGGAVRELQYREEDELTLEYIKAKAMKFFFPEGNSKYGPLDEMDVEVGNYSQERLLEFRDADGKICSFSEYLQSRGLYSSKFTLYLMSTCKESCNKALNEDVLTSGTSKTSQEKGRDPEPSNCSIFAVKIGPESIHFNSEKMNDNHLCIGYERQTFSSYSEEVLCRSLSFSRKDCYDMISFSDLEILGMDLSNFDPLDYDYTVCNISKGQKCFLSAEYESTLDESEISVVFPQSDFATNRLILHSPSEIWGYDGNQLVLGVVATCHLSSDVWFVWYQNDTNIKEGKHNCCLPIKSPGSYKVEVRSKGNSEISEPVYVYPVNVPLEGDQSSSTSTTVSSATSPECEPQLPVINKEDIEFSLKDVIGSGSFGTVFRGNWAGTEVAVKQVKVRNAARLRSIVNQEVKVHSLARHPNIVQLMAISYSKNAIHLVSELVDGQNLEDLIFSDDNAFFESCDRCSLAKQISQAVAYLHNLRPPIVHRDIKPANVIVSKHTHVAKLCDMGLSKLKSTQSVSMTTGTLTGTPAYMAPECLVYNKTATVGSDVWSLACTLLELFTGKECWEIPEGDNSDAQDFISAAMKKKENPPALSYLVDVLSDSRHNTLQVVIGECFNYANDERPPAIDIVKALTASV